MKWLNVILMLSVIISCYPGQENHPPEARNASELKLVRSLPEFVDELFRTCRVQLSEARRTSVRDQAVRIAQEYFPARKDQEAFLLMVCIESRFQSGIVSKAGATGYTQLMPKFAQTFSDTCQLGKLDVSSDLKDGELNLKLGACHFRDLLKQFDGNVALVLSAYNSGAESKTTKQLGKGSEIGAHPETLGYLSKYLVLQEQMK